MALFATRGWRAAVITALVTPLVTAIMPVVSAFIASLVAAFITAIIAPFLAALFAARFMPVVAPLVGTPVTTVVTAGIAMVVTPVLAAILAAFVMGAVLFAPARACSACALVGHLRMGGRAGHQRGGHANRGQQAKLLQRQNGSRHGIRMSFHENPRNEELSQRPLRRNNHPSTK